MEGFALYLLKSVIWLTGFALVYVLFLRNERFFLLNRFYLLTGIIASLLFPFISLHYTVVVPINGNIVIGGTPVTRVAEQGSSRMIYLTLSLLAIYIAGTLFVAYKLFRQSKMVIGVIKKAEATVLHSIKLIRTAEYFTSFSLFSYVFVNPSVTDIEAKEIVNHEMVHIQQRHWVDLVLVELLCLLQWFNPVVWIYIRFIRQNHEYLADEVALQRSSNPAIYRAALLNQIFGAPVIVLANSFNSSINKKRFNMMKNIITSPYRKMKLLLILPVIAVVLYSFARPDYKYISYDESKIIAGSVSSQTTKEVKGTVLNTSGLPLTGATVVLRGTTSGVSSDSKGFFRIKDVPEDGVLIVSYVGFKTKAIKPVFTADMTIKMESDTVTLKSIGVPPPPPPPPPSKKAKTSPASPTSPSSPNYATSPALPPPPPPPPGSIDRLGSGGKPLIIVNGVVRDIEINRIDPNTIESITVLKDEASKVLYGEKAKDGVIKIVLKPGVSSADLNTPPGTKSDEIVVVGYGKESSGSSSVRIRNSSGESMSDALVVIDGVIHEYSKLEEMNPSSIESMNVYKGEKATDKYGEKAKNGVIEIITKTGSSSKLIVLPEVKIDGDKNSGDAYVVVEEMPVFPGGEKAIQAWIYGNIKVKKGSEKISEPVYVVFTVDSKGKVRDAQVLKKKYPVWEAEAIRVVSSMPDWKPGSQNGKPIDVIMQLPIDFSTVKK